jgi:hypothetical protein
MSYSFTNAEMGAIHERAMATARGGELLGGPPRREPLPSEEEVLLGDLSAIRSLGVTAIEYEPYLLGFEEYRVLETRLRDERQARSAVEGLFAMYLTEYAALVRSNFPTLAEHFPLLQHLPLRVGIEMDTNRLSADDGLGGCTVTLSEGRSEETSPAELDTSGRTTRTVDAGRRVWSTGRGFRFAAFWSTMEPHLPFQIRGGCPLRTLVYESLCEDMEVAFGALCQQYGVAPVSDRQRWRV